MADNFAIGPGVANTDVIDFTTSTGIKLFGAATGSLYGDKASRFDVNAKGIHSFLGLIEEHGMYHGLTGGTGILDIPVDIAVPLGETTSLVTSYGLIMIEHLREHVETYSGEPVRAKQDSAMLFKCLMASLSVKGRDKVRIWKDDYSVVGHVSGALLMKVIIRQSSVDTNATTRHIRMKFTRLDSTFAKMNYDVEQLNLYVLTWLEGLAARGGTTTDLSTHLFKAYKTSPNADLVDYVKDKQNAFDEGANVTANELMQMIVVKYSNLKEEEEEEYVHIKPESEDIIALQAQVEELKQAMTRKGQSGGSVPKSGSTQRPPMESWKKTAPTADEISKGYKKLVNGKEFFYCTKHGYWCAHLAKDCHSKLKNEGNKPSEEQKRLVNAMMALQEEADEESE